jgi:hypothetical protein
MPEVLPGCATPPCLFRPIHPHRQRTVLCVVTPKPVSLKPVDLTVNDIVVPISCLKLN